ncbi:MAG: fibronectin type III domain-containing protein [Terracidiphilus sp.]
MRTKHILQWAAAAAVLATALTGCGTPGAPQPPSLNLAEPVGDLVATRAGSQVTLSWTMPKRSTDKLLLKGNVAVRVCRQEGAGICTATGPDLAFTPGADAAFTDTLPSTLTVGPPRPLSYFVELRNRNGRSAGLSNAAVILAGEAPAPVTGLIAEAHKAGVVLRWTPVGESAAVRLRRNLLTPPPAAKPQQGLLAPAPEPVEQSLLVEADKRQTIDKTIRLGQTYEYRAQRVARVALGGKTLELAGELSAPVRVEAQDIFPPEAPTGLAAVATTGDSPVQNAIDLSWQPVPDANLAGYIVYRHESDAPWQRLSTAAPLLGPAFHDAQVQPGHTYHYTVSALGQNGHESPRSAETEETVPNP